MRARTHKNQDNRNNAVAQIVSRNSGADEATVQFVDNRPQAVQFGKLQRAAESNPPQIPPPKAMPVALQRQGAPGNEIPPQGKDFHDCTGQRQPRRFESTVQIRKLPTNDDQTTDREMDLMRTEALQWQRPDQIAPHPAQPPTGTIATTIQRRITAKKLKKFGKVNPVLLEIQQLLAEYEKIKQKEVPPSEILTFISRIEKAIYAWYNTQKVADFSMADQKELTLIRELENQLDEDYQRNAEAFSLSEDEDELWQLIVSGEGPIRIEGSPRFQSAAHAMLLRLFHSKVGRQILEVILRQEDGRVVTVGEGNPPEALAPLLHTKITDESKAIPQLLSGREELPEESERAEIIEQLLADLTLVKPIKRPPREERANYPALNVAGDLLKIIGKKSVGFTIGTGKMKRYFKFAAGAHGAFVAVIDSEETQSNRGIEGQAIHTPLFVTLAHELGHAVNQIMGAATLDVENIFAAMVPDLGAYTEQTPIRKNWTNVEEFLTIEGIENALRGELGLALRGGHAAAIDEELAQRMNGLRVLVGDAFVFIKKLDEFKGKEDLLQRLFKLRSVPIKGLAHPERLERCMAYTQEIQYAFGSIRKAFSVELVLARLDKSMQLKIDIWKYAPIVFRELGFKRAKPPKSGKSKKLDYAEEGADPELSQALVASLETDVPGFDGVLRAGFKAIPNTGSGMDCLIISLLQSVGAHTADREDAISSMLEIEGLRDAGEQIWDDAAAVQAVVNWINNELDIAVRIIWVRPAVGDMPVVFEGPEAPGASHNVYLLAAEGHYTLLI